MTYVLSSKAVEFPSYTQVLTTQRRRGRQAKEER